VSPAPTISVVVTAYNAEPFVGDAVRSVLGQTHADFECLVIDDGSTDGTLGAVRAIEDPRLRVIAAGRIGRGRALNLGLRESRGRYVAVQDADDLAHPRRLEIELAALDGRSDYGGVGTGALLLPSPSSPPVWPPTAAVEGGGGGSPPLRDVSRSVVYLNPLCHTSLLLRREALAAVNGYDEGRTSQYDWDLLIRLVAAGYRLGRLPVPLAARRMHPRQFFERRNRWRYVRAGYGLQRAARRALGRSWLLEPVLLALCGYRLLPRGLRLGWRRSVLGPG
jgi:teichuronic acid biosynthesis glycosyltransferase TuaG